MWKIDGKMWQLFETFEKSVKKFSKMWKISKKFENVLSNNIPINLKSNKDNLNTKSKWNQLQNGQLALRIYIWIWRNLFLKQF